MLRLLSAGCLMMLAACASGGGPSVKGAAMAADASTRCAGIVSDSLLGAVPVYPECGVSTQAKIQGSGLRLQYNSPRRTNCVSATLRVVVDEQGNVVPRTAKVVRSTDPDLATAMMAALPTLRYQPAMKDGKAVAQLVDVEYMVAQPQSRRPGAATRTTMPRC